MPLTQIAPPYPIFTDTDGKPLDNGYLYIGVINTDPTITANQIAVYWDSDFTLPAPQPIRTINGYPSRNGSPAQIYCNSQFSLTIKDKNQALVLYSRVGYAINPGAVVGSAIPYNYTGDGSTVNFTLPVTPTTENATNVYVNGAYQNKDTYSLSGAIVTFQAAPPNGSAIEIVVTESAAIGTINATNVVYTPAGTGAVTTNVKTVLDETVSVKRFGAVGDGVTDDTAAIQAALDYCEASGKLIFGDAGTYRITSTIVIKCSGDMSAMTLNVNAASVSKAVQVGPAAAGQYLFDTDLKLPFVTNKDKTGAGWTGFDSSVGVEVANVYQSRITVPSVYNFGVGLKVGGYSVGNVYNTYSIGVLFGNKINLQCKPGDANGWSNQNTFIGGRYGYSSAEGTAVSGVIQVQLRDFDATGPNAPNTNVWLNPSVEGNEPEFHFDIQGSYNTVISPRLELSGGAAAKINFHAVSANETVSNNFIGGYKSGATYTFSGAGTSVNNGYIASRGSNTFDFSGSGYNTRNTSGNSISAPHFQGFPATTQPLPKDNTATDWTYRIFGEGFAVKSTSNTQPRIQMDSSGYLFFGSGSSALAGGVRYNSSVAAITSNIAFAPDSDNNLTLGTAFRRWSEVFAGTGTINTSDEREKTPLLDLNEAEKAVATELKQAIKKFKFKDAVESKGDSARIHIGVGAQTVKAIFESHGLIAEEYAILCYNEWEATEEILDDDGNVIEPAKPAGNRYGVRYDELLAFIISAM